MNDPLATSGTAHMTADATKANAGDAPTRPVPTNHSLPPLRGSCWRPGVFRPGRDRLGHACWSRPRQAAPEVPAVITDNARGMRRAVEHLAELGHQTVTYVAGPEASWADGVRWVALMEACNETGPAVSSRRTVQRADGPCRLGHRGRGPRAEADGGHRLQRRDGHRRHQGMRGAGVQNLIAAISGSSPSRDPVILPVKLLVAVRPAVPRSRRRMTPC